MSFIKLAWATANGWRRLGLVITLVAVVGGLLTDLIFRKQLLGLMLFPVIEITNVSVLVLFGLLALIGGWTSRSAGLIGLAAIFVVVMVSIPLVVQLYFTPISSVFMIWRSTVLAIFGPWLVLFVGLLFAGSQKFNRKGPAEMTT